MNRRLAVCVFLVLSTGCVSSWAQTFDVSPQASATRPKQKRAGKAPQTATDSQSSIGWGSGLEVARQARAAQDALRSQRYAEAAAHAERAANAAPQNADLWFLFGYAARLAGRYPASEAAFKRGLAAKPSSVQGLSGLAQTYAKMGRRGEAQQILEQVIAANPRSPNDLQLAGELFLTSDPQRGLDLLTRSEALAANPRTELLAARAYQLLKRPEDARRMLERARSRAPHDPNVLRAVAGYYRETGNYDEAVSALQQVSSRPPDYWGEMGYTYQLAGKKKEAADAYVRAAKSSKGEIGYQLSAALALLNVNQFDQAANFMDRAAALNPNHYRLHAIRGQMASMQNRPEDAIREYKAAIASLPPEGVPEGVLYPIELHVDLYQQYRITDNDEAATQEINLAAAQLKNMEVGDAGRPEFLRLRAAVAAASDNFEAAEKDLKEALTLEPSNINLMLNYANLRWRMQRQSEAAKLYQEVLKREPNNRSALSSLGFIARDVNDPKAAEEYFSKLEKLYPDDHVAYLALGDLYTSQEQLPRALANYEKAHRLAPKNALVVSRGANAAIEAKDLKLTKAWLDRADDVMNRNPQVMRERERYLTLTGNYAESAELGYKVLEKLPRDPEAPVYLGYDLIFLGKYKEALAVAQKHQPILPKDKDLHLIAGHAHRELGFLDDAVKDFSEALERDPSMATGYMDRGYVLNELRRAAEAARDFQTAIKLNKDYGEAHLGLAMADLQLHRPGEALKEVNIAERLLGASAATHGTRAESFRQRVLLADAEREYRAALTFNPKDVETHIALADAIYRLHRYQEAADVLKQAATLRENDPLIYSRLAAIYAKLGREQETIEYAQKAEAAAGGKGSVFLAIGEAFLTLGERDAAMQRFARALEDPDGDTVQTRMAIARVFVREGRRDDAREQVGIAFAESRIGEGTPIIAQHLVDAAGIFLSLHEFELAKQYLQRARAAGADDGVVAIAMANAYLAEGQTDNAQTELSLLANQEGYQNNYDYLMAQGNVYRQRQQNLQALTTFARANQIAGDDRTAEQAQYDLAAAEGRQYTQNVSLSSDVSFSPLFEDINIYTMDAKLQEGGPNTLPLPRSSFESRARAIYHLHFTGWPTLNGFVEERNARGRISIPSRAVIQDRNTYDTSFNTGVSPTVRLGPATLFLNTGVQFTLRRDKISPTEMNQNLFRQFLYLSTNPLFNWVTISGGAMHETGPFTEQSLHSRDASAFINFKVGRPWGSTALVSGYAVRDALFRPSIREYFTTNAYVGVQQRFGKKLQLTVLADYLRSWRVEGINWAIAQAIRPVTQFQYKASPQWSVEGSFAWSRGQGFHVYDNVQSGLMVSYTKPVRRTLHEQDGEVSVAYPWRFSFGFQQQQFYNFSSQNRSTFLPVIRLSFF